MEGGAARAGAAAEITRGGGAGEAAGEDVQVDVEEASALRRCPNGRELSARAFETQPQRAQPLETLGCAHLIHPVISGPA